MGCESLRIQRQIAHSSFPQKAALLMVFPFHVISLRKRRSYRAHFTGEKTEVQRNYVTYPRPYGKEAGVGVKTPIHICLTHKSVHQVILVYGFGSCVSVCVFARRVCSHAPRVEKHLYLKRDVLWCVCSSGQWLLFVLISESLAMCVQRCGF